MFNPGKPFQSGLLFAGMAEAFPSEAPLRCSTLGYAPGFTRKHTRLEMFARDKHSSLLRKFVNYGCKKSYNIGPRVEVANTLAYYGAATSTAMKFFIVQAHSGQKNNVC